MSIQLQRRPGDRFLELGGGDKPAVHPTCLGGKDVNVDVRTCFTPDGKQTTDFTVDLNEPLPIQDAEFDGCVSVWAVEHVSWRRVPQLIGEMHRVTKPGGSLLLVLPNTEAQLRYILSGKPVKHKDGFFVEASRILFGDQDYTANSHAVYLSPAIVVELLSAAGFREVKVTAYGELATDMIVEAVKPFKTTETAPGVYATEIPASHTEGETVSSFPKHQIAVASESTHRGFTEGDWQAKSEEQIPKGRPAPPPRQSAADRDLFAQGDGGKAYQYVEQENPKHYEKPAPLPSEPVSQPEEPKAVFVRDFPPPSSPTQPPAPYDPAATFDRAYFDGGKLGGGYQLYLDFPCHEITARHVLSRKPESVLELGCGRGYVLKRLQDAGVKAHGVDVSKHCYLARVANDIHQFDLCSIPWPLQASMGGMGTLGGVDSRYDFCLSVAVLEHIPEAKLPDVIREMRRTCRRGLHGVFFCPAGEDGDKTKLTLKPKEWWRNLFHEVAPEWPCEIVDKNELEAGPFPPEVLKGDGKGKLNLGCAQMMFHYGWVNVDGIDYGNWPAANGYQYTRADLRNGLPFAKTDAVSLIYSAHCLEHLSYKEGLALLKECRRVIKADGAMRIIVPDARLLTIRYHNHVCDITGNHSDFGTETLDEFDQLNAGCAECPMAAGKLWSLLGAGHASAYDAETLIKLLEEAGWAARVASFRQLSKSADGGAQSRHAGLAQILRETLDVLPSLSLYVDAVPRIET